MTTATTWSGWRRLLEERLSTSRATQFTGPFALTSRSSEEDGTMSFGGRNDNGTVREIEAAAAPPRDRQA